MSVEEREADRAETPAQTPASDGDLGHEKKKGRSGKSIFWIVVAIAALIIVLAIGIVPRLKTGKTAKSQAATSATLQNTVETVTPTKSPSNAKLLLPGNIEALTQTSVYARATGYLKQWLVDIGDRVQAGQTLAIIETPDADQETAQARAQLASSQAAASQAEANVVSMEGNLEQARADLSRSYASVAQAQQQTAQARSQLAQAQQAAASSQAQLVQAESSRDLAKVTAQRYQNLVNQQAVDQQTADQELVTYRNSVANVQALQASYGASQANVESFRSGVNAAAANVQAYKDAVNASLAAVRTAQANVEANRANLAAAQANVVSSEANLNRLVVLQSFQKVTAPFSGVITARNVENGALIGSSSQSSSGSDGSTSAGTSTSGSAASGGLSGSSALGGSTSSSSSSSSSGGGGSGGSLFSIAQTSTMRIYINVPQDYSTFIKPGIKAKIQISELMHHNFSGVIRRTADAFDPSSRTIVAEVDIPNPTGILKPGMFAEVALTIPTVGRILLIPDSTLINNSAGTQVAVVDKNSTVQMTTIALGRDFGTTIQVLNGLKKGDQIIDNPRDGLVSGLKVHASPEPATASDGTGGGSASGGHHRQAGA